MVQLSFGRPWKKKFIYYPVQLALSLSPALMTFRDPQSSFSQQKYFILHRNHQKSACYAVEGDRLEFADANPKVQISILPPSPLDISIVIAQRGPFTLRSMTLSNFYGLYELTLLHNLYQECMIKMLASPGRRGQTGTYNKIPQ